MRYNEGVGAGVKVGDVNIDLLVLNTRHGTDLGHEENQITHVNVVAETVNDEEEV